MDTLQFTLYEDFAYIPDYDNGYAISKSGVVISYRRNQPTILCQKNVEGYRQVALTKNRHTRYIAVHRLVMLVFVGADKREVNHKNGIKDDNHLDNLEYVTSRENKQHAIHTLGRKIGGNMYEHRRGDQASHVKLTTEQVLELRELAASTGWSIRKIARHFGIGYSQAGRIIRGESWTHLP